MEDDDVAENELEEDDVEDDEDKGRKMMMLRRRTDPKFTTLTLCEPVQLKCTCKCRKSHLMQKRN